MATLVGPAVPTNQLIQAPIVSALDASQTPPAETDAERSRRIAWEAKGIAEARAQLAAGFYVDSADVGAWINRIGTDNKFPLPPIRRR